MKALVTGITGMCGSHLAELLLEKGYEVHGLIRFFEKDQNIQHLKSKITLHYGDLADFGSLFEIINKVRPDEIYNLAAQSHAGISFKNVEYTLDITGLGVARLLEIVRQIDPKIKFFQASTSENFNHTAPLPWNEETKLKPSNPYGCAKVLGHLMVQLYRRAYGIFACNGILFNNESLRRDESFVTRKITLAAAQIKKGLQNELLLGNIEAKRDWGFAPEYMEAAWLMLQANEPDDYVIATGESHSVREWMEAAFEAVGLNAYDYYKQDERFMRPAEVPEMIGDITKIKTKLGWEPKTKFKDLVKIMVESDL